MSAYDKTFEWIDFPQGRVRCTGGGANREEPKEVFAVELYGQTYYGQIKRQFSSNGNDYNLEVVSFGWPKDGWFGAEPDPESCAAFTLKNLETIKILLCQTVQIWRSFDNDDRPIFLNESSKSHFMGQVLFRDRWALAQDEGIAS
ncbi:MAG: hypothetical protein LBF16_07850 [Pseudomonadales bacterium]|jgi:hypothetical protein|nr:hypothetical protein [Pseudomonadales bacterium]